MVWQLCERYSTVSPRKGWHLICFMNDIGSCSFFGHREITATDELRSAVRREIASYIERGCKIFYFGGYGEFDRLCYETLTEIKEALSLDGIKRVYCVSQERYLRKRTRYFDPDDYDELAYLAPAFEGWYKSIYYRNLAMRDASDAVLFFCEERAISGAYKAYKYAIKKKDKLITNLYKEIT